MFVSHLRSSMCNLIDGLYYFSDYNSVLTWLQTAIMAMITTHTRSLRHSPTSSSQSTGREDKYSVLELTAEDLYSRMILQI